MSNTQKFLIPLVYTAELDNLRLKRRRTEVIGRPQ